MPQNVYIYDPEVPVPEDVKHVEIPQGVTDIRENAFRNCKSLQSVAIPDSVTKIGDYAFGGCFDLQSVTIPDSVTTIGNNAFNDCRNLQFAVIPDSVTEIGIQAFVNCHALESVTIPNRITEISDSIFGGCYSLSSVTIPDGVTRIGDCAFWECAFRSVIIPDSVTEIGSWAFCNCSNIQSVTIPDSVTIMGEAVFDSCIGLQSVTLSNRIIKIDDDTFFGCQELRSVIIPDSVTEIEDGAFYDCRSLRSVIMPDSVTKIEKSAFKFCSALQSLMYKGINIAPFINIDGYGVNTFDIIRFLIEHRIPLNESTVREGIDTQHQGGLEQWTREYHLYGTMRFSPAMKSPDRETEERLRRCFSVQKKTGCRIPKILSELAVTVRVCGIPPERLAATFDIRYTEDLIRDRIPLVPAEACRCYCSRDVCDTLIQKGRVFIMAEAIVLYNRSGCQECYRHLIDFIASHTDTKIEDLQYAVEHAAEIPIMAGTTPAQVRQHRAYMNSLEEVVKIETVYQKIIPGFRLSDYPCNLKQTGVVYDGMTARTLDLSDKKDIALAAKLGDLTNCCQRFKSAGETAMMHGFMNPDAGFWVIEGRDGTIKAQAEIWETDKGTLVFDNIEFANTDKRHRPERIEQLRGVIAAWATESGYKNIIMGCGFNELNVGFMERAPIPKLRLTPEEVFALRKDNSAGASFDNIDEARQYMQTNEYNPDDFVYTDAGERCVYIKKDGAVSDYLMQGYDEQLAGNRNPHEKNPPVKEYSHILL